MAAPVARRLAVTVALVGVLAGACARAPEYLLIERFFAASRLRDRTALARFSTVVFEPLEQGTVSSFTVVDIAPDVRQPDVPPALRDRLPALSLFDPMRPDEPLPSIEAVVLREVTVQATVRQPNGTAGPRSLVIVLQRAEPAAGRGGPGRWVITGFR